MIDIQRIKGCNLPLPEKQTVGSAGFDLQANDITNFINLRSGTQQLIGTGFIWEIPKDHVGIIKPRSGLANKYGIDVMAGVIDSDYRGEVKVILRNHGVHDFRIPEGERIAQMIIIKISISDKLEEVFDLDKTERGEDGFGSTGTK